MTGGDRLRSGKAGLVRATWERPGPNVVRQLFETSANGGVTWETDLRILYRRK